MPAMSEFETRSIEQLPLATSVSPDALTAVQEPGGPVKRLKIRQLLGRLISTDEATATEADLQALLDYPANSIGLTFADPNPAKNGWWRKTGASGAGNWVQFEKLSADASAEVQALVDAATEQAELAEAAKDAAEAAAADAEDLAAGVSDLRIELRDAGLSRYTGDGPYFPIVMFPGNRIGFGFNAETGEFFGDGLVNVSSLKAMVEERVLGPMGLAEYTGNGPFPLAMTRDGAILLGYDPATESLITPGGGSLSLQAAAAVATLEDLPEPLIPATWNAAFGYGQSLSVGAKSLPVISTSQPYSNRTWIGGPRAAGFDLTQTKLLVEDNLPGAGGADRGETICSGAANYWSTLIATEEGLDPNDYVIFAVSAGEGGAPLSLLEKGGTVWTDRLIPWLNAAKALQSSIAVHVMPMAHGEQDAANGLAQALYRGGIKDLADDINTDIPAITGQTSPVYLLIYQCSWRTAAHPDIALAQLEAAQQHDQIVLVTPTYFLPYDADGVHLTNVGNKWLGCYFGLFSWLLTRANKMPRWLQPRSATVRGARIDVHFDVPYGPLTFDTQTIAKTDDYGFAVADDGDPVGIASISCGSDSVTIMLDAAPSGSVQVRYALDNLAPGLAINSTTNPSASGNLRDNAPWRAVVAGDEVRLANWCPHFRMTAIRIGE